MRRAAQAAAWLVAAAVAAGGCIPTDVPRFSPDGRHLAFLLRAPEAAGDGTATVGVVPAAGGPWRRVRLPEPWAADGFIWLGEKLLVQALRVEPEVPAEGAAGAAEAPAAPDGAQDAADDEDEARATARFWLADPTTGRAAPTDVEAPPFTSPFVGTFIGKPALYVPGDGRTRVYAARDLSPLGTLAYAAEGAGDGWIVRVVEAKDETGGGARITGVEVLNPDLHRVVAIPREEFAKVCYRGARRPKAARVSTDRRHILLGFGTETIYRRHAYEYTFGVFDMRTGKVVWNGSSNNLHGLPAVVGNLVYALEAKERAISTDERTPAAMVQGPAPASRPTDRVVLARYTPARRTEVLDVPLAEGETAARYSCGPDRKRFVLQTEGPRPRLLVVPIGPAVKAENVRAIRLGEEAKP